MLSLTPEKSIEKATLLDNWVMFDLNIWSDDPKLDIAVDRIFGILAIIPGFNARPKVRKKLLKIAMLNLYNAFLTDPTMYVGYHRGSTYYSKIPARYNPNKVRRTLIEVIDALCGKGFVEHHMGHYDRSGGSKSHLSRMKAYDGLIIIFNEVLHRRSISIEKAPTTECIILRDYDKKSDSQFDIDFEDNPETIRMRRELTAYNNLLRRSFIDIPFFHEDGAPSSSERRNIKINRSNKFVRRIFNNGVWDNGGRFYGGWWQNLPKEWRKEIRFGVIPAIEIDYSGLHIILLYALEGIDYWRDIADDPYSLPGYEHDDKIRRLLKIVLLTAINAKSKTSAIKAVRRQINNDLDEWGWLHGYDLKLTEIVDSFSERHEPIKRFFFTGKGSVLQNLDSIIAEHVINWFTRINQPVLCIHDSFIVASIFEIHLREQMSKAFEVVVDHICGDEMKRSAKVKAIGITEAYFERYRTSSPYTLEGDPEYGLLGTPLKDRGFDKRLIEYLYAEDGTGFRKFTAGEIDITKIVEGDTELFELHGDYYRVK